MKKIFSILFIAALCSWQSVYAQSGSDVIICLDNSASISNQEFADMTTSTKALITAILKCNPNNRVAVVHYGTNYFSGYSSSQFPISEPRIFIESDFTNNSTTALSFSRKLYFGDHFHEAVGMMGHALDNISDVNIVSPQKVLQRNPARSLIMFLFTDAGRDGGGLSGGSYLVNFYSSAPSSNGAFHDFTAFKNNRGAKFVLVHVMNDITSIKAAASIASMGGAYNGPIETYPADPDNNQLPRFYLNKNNFLLTNAEISSVSGNICAIAGHNDSISIRYEPLGCVLTAFPVSFNGYYSIPPGASIVSLQASLIHTTTNVSYSISATPTITGNTFSFTFNQANINIPPPITGQYKIAVTMQYNLGGIPHTVIGYNVLAPGSYDMNFDCCPFDLYITTTVVPPNADIQQANNSITAVNIIEPDATGDYSAGKFVLLKDGFHAKAKSRFRGYIKMCGALINKAEAAPESDYYVDRDADPNNLRGLQQAKQEHQESIQITPNPSDGIFKVSFGNTSSGLLQLMDLNGTIVYKQSFKDEKGKEVNVQQLPKGFYMLAIIFENGQTVSRKVVLK